MEKINQDNIIAIAWGEAEVAGAWMFREGLSEQEWSVGKQPVRQCSGC